MIQIKNRFNSRIILEIADLSGADLSGADLYCADLYCADLREANLCGADIRGANLRGANLYCANLRGADIRGADLRGADIRGADFYCADIRGADLSGADLRGADIRGANLYRAHLCESYVLISGSRHWFCGFSNYIQIGCYYYSIEYWKKMYNTIGKSEGYTEEEIQEYYKHIKMYEELYLNHRRKK